MATRHQSGVLVSSVCEAFHAYRALHAVYRVWTKPQDGLQEDSAESVEVSLPEYGLGLCVLAPDSLHLPQEKNK